MSDISDRQRGRFAPSPTGAMHAGNARTALLAWLAARIGGGAFILRVEDLDRARVLPGVEAALIDDLTWLGIDWDEGPDRGGSFGPYRQSERTGHYAAAIDYLLSTGRAFRCACSRTDVARAASAPHADDEEGPRYPGTCRGLDPVDVEARARALGRAVTVRFDGRGKRIPFTDEVRGAIEPFGPAGIDDFVLRRADGVAAYQLAVVVDDAAMKIDQVIRGDDLVISTPRQIALHRALGFAPPRFAHVPLLLTGQGDRLAKRTRPSSIAAMRERGMEACELVGRLAFSAGLCEAGARLSPTELLARIPSQRELWSCLSHALAIWDHERATSEAH